MKVQNRIVTVFKTSVTKKSFANNLRKEILLYSNVMTCNFDLMDCDNILRIESNVEIAEKVIALLNDKGFLCEELI